MLERITRSMHGQFIFLPEFRVGVWSRRRAPTPSTQTCITDAARFMLKFMPESLAWEKLADGSSGDKGMKDFCR